MTPFLQFRIWFRRASVGTRFSVGLATALLLALVVWSAVPSSTSSTHLAATAAGNQAQGGVPGSSAGRSGPTGTGAGSPSGPGAPVGTDTGGSVPSIGATTPGASDGGASSTSGPATSVVSSGQGCSKRGTLRIGVVVPEGAGGSLNAVIGNPATSEEEADYAAVMDGVNKAGGVGCDNLVGDFATADLTNPSSARAGCLQFQQDKVFAVLGGFEPLFSDDCTLQAHIPTFDELPIPAGSAQKYYPYFFSTYPTWQRLYKNFVDAVDRMGYLGAGKHFAKLGIFYESCTPEIMQALLSDLAAVGVSGSKVVTYDLGCNSAFSPPSAVEQAVLKFKSAGVTTATMSDDIADGQNISNFANGQGWKPTWILPDYGEVSVQNASSEHPNATEFDGATAITAGQYGAIPAHLPETAGTQRCDRIMTSHHLPTVYQSGDQFAGSTCSLVWMLVGALQHSAISQTAIVTGLQAAKSIDLSFPNGPDDFSAPGTTAGGEFWRTDTYHSSCQCWETDSPTWNPSFP